VSTTTRRRTKHVHRHHGATGNFGRLTVEALLRRGVPAEQIIATGRRIETLGDLGDRGVSLRRADYSDEISLREAFAGADRLLLVSGTEVGQRIQQHTNVIAAAKATGVQLIAYTSVVRADTSQLLIAHEHRGTEAALAASGVPQTLLRVSWYIDNYTAQLPDTWSTALSVPPTTGESAGHPC
jgi:NAD(P)H dehydrogenase (quinone)